MERNPLRLSDDEIFNCARRTENPRVKGGLFPEEFVCLCGEMGMSYEEANEYYEAQTGRTLKSSLTNLNSLILLK
jgi:hypothetical protein